MVIASYSIKSVFPINPTQWSVCPRFTASLLTGSLFNAATWTIFNRYKQCMIWYPWVVQTDCAKGISSKLNGCVRVPLTGCSFSSTACPSSTYQSNGPYFAAQRSDSSLSKQRGWIQPNDMMSHRQPRSIASCAEIPQWATTWEPPWEGGGGVFGTTPLWLSTRRVVRVTAPRTRMARMLEMKKILWWVWFLVSSSDEEESSSSIDATDDEVVLASNFSSLPLFSSEGNAPIRW